VYKMGWMTDLTYQYCITYYPCCEVLQETPGLKVRKYNFSMVSSPVYEIGH